MFENEETADVAETGNPPGTHPGVSAAGIPAEEPQKADPVPGEPGDDEAAPDGGPSTEGDPAPPTGDTPPAPPAPGGTPPSPPAPPAPPAGSGEPGGVAE